MNCHVRSVIAFTAGVSTDSGAFVVGRVDGTRLRPYPPRRPQAYSLPHAFGCAIVAKTAGSVDIHHSR